MLYEKLVAVACMLLVSATLVFAEGSKEKPAASAEKTYTIKLGHTMSTAHPRHLALLEFEKYVEEKTNGKVQVELYPAAVLGSEPLISSSRWFWYHGRKEETWLTFVQRFLMF